MNALFESPTAYTVEFETAWKAWQPARNEAKAVAYASFQKTAKRRMSAGAFGSRLIACIDGYNTWRDMENAGRSRKRQSEIPKCHFSTWLNQHRYESFMAEANAQAAKAIADSAKGKIACDGWEKEADSLIAELTDAKFTSWFGNVEVKRGDPVEIVFPNSFRASYVAKSFPFALRRAFGNCFLTAAGSTEKYEI